jgi:hypothetical protein
LWNLGKKKNPKVTKVKGGLLGRFKKGEREGGGGITEGMNIIKVHCIHVWKCHNELLYFVQLRYTKAKQKKNLLQNYFTLPCCIFSFATVLLVSAKPNYLSVLKPVPFPASVFYFVLLYKHSCLQNLLGKIYESI